MSVPSIPTTYTHKLDPIAPFDVDVDATIEAQHSGSLATIVSGALATSSTVDILNLPHFTLQDIKDMMKVRVHIPNYSNICFKMMGMELFSICIGGEAQVITEPYIPTAMEKCEDACCEPDTRPFPVRKGNENQPNSFIQSV